MAKKDESEVKEAVGEFIEEERPKQDSKPEPKPSTGQDGKDTRRTLQHNWDGVTLPDYEALGMTMIKLFEEVKERDSAHLTLAPFVLDATWDQDDPDLLHIELEIMSGARVFCEPDDEDSDAGRGVY